ncbi:MAG: adenylosuccinate synthase [Clostridiales bacterium]|nr:adenylosuccinate synthase [Clostridiales bacterium]MDY3763508.1 adenylosuccinate synthase [Candidatus Ventricola sp.]MCI6587790.1 adenylosuccinate synthase [Clostridiales bacterium]MCI7705170.1 adenylosuccinate synthase [Clostridiales bacterium]MDY3832750.1 adenylosuccinate synthase [Candidatus Ventricola sp.]
MSNCAIVGINWGDEGKGRMVDLLTENYDVVVRFQGGGNAGHTVINEYGKFALHLLPSGIFRPGVVNILGNGVALDPENLWIEMQTVMDQGVALTPENLMISDRASLLLPWHRRLDELEEQRLADKKFGSTKQGIAPFYSDKYQKKTVLAGELFYPDHLRSHLADIMEWKNLTLEKVYGAQPYTQEMIDEWLENYCEKIKPFIRDTGAFLADAQKAGKNILFEAQLGSLRDLDYGIHPYTTSSNTTAAYAPIGSGLPSAKIDDVIGVVKAYSTCVGEGPFVCEMFGKEAEALRQAGAEYGAKTGRPRRVGPIDLVATRYGVEVQAATEIALTKLDVLSDMPRIPLCTAYQLGGEKTNRFPFPAALADARPVIDYVDGWCCDISGARTWEELPPAAQEYVLFIEKAIGCPITYVSVGPERESIILRKQAHK